MLEEKSLKIKKRVEIQGAELRLRLGLCSIEAKSLFYLYSKVLICVKVNIVDLIGEIRALILMQCLGM